MLGLFFRVIGVARSLRKHLKETMSEQGSDVESRTSSHPHYWNDLDDNFERLRYFFFLIFL